MTTITIRNLDDRVEALLRIRAELNSSSIEEEARQILCDAVRTVTYKVRNLTAFTRECFEPIGFVELKPPERGSMREPPRFS